MPYVLYQGDKRTIEDILNGRLSLRPIPNKGLPLGGLTLIFNSPAATVTFTGAAGALVTPDQIVTDINAVVGLAGVARHRADPGGQIASNNSDSSVSYDRIVELQLDAGLNIDTAGTANALLGLSTTADTVRALIPQNKIAALTNGSASGMYALLVAP